MREFELGINYWPRRRAMYMWRELDLGEVRDELAHIADIGFDVVRLFTLAEDFLPEPDVVSGEMIARFVGVARAATDAGLRIVPTIVVINMSGRMWWPPWMRSSHSTADLYRDPAVVGAVLHLAESCASALAGDVGVRAIDIANEIDDAQRPFSRDVATVWVSSMAAAIRKHAPETPIRIGAHLPSLTTENHMRIDDLASILDEDVMHAYPLYSKHARSFLDPELVPFACALTANLSGKDRPALVQEFGLCTAAKGVAGHPITDDFLGEPRSQYLASEDEAATYYEGVVTRLARQGGAGAYAWCYADYEPSLFARPPLDRAVRERTFGLVRADGREKPAAKVFREFRRRRDAGMLQRGEVPKILDVTADEYYCAPGEHFARLYEHWVATQA